MVHRRILPESPNFINNRKVQSAPGLKRRKTVEHRGMSVQDIRLFLRCHLKNAVFDDFHHPFFREEGKSSVNLAAAVITKIPNILQRPALFFPIFLMLGRSYDNRFPAALLLSPENGLAAESIAAVQGQAVV